MGKSGSGKTTLLNSLLLKPDVLDYENLMVCGKSLHQPSYKIMQLGFDKGLSKTQIGKIFIRKDKVMEDGESFVTSLRRHKRVFNILFFAI